MSTPSHFPAIVIGAGSAGLSSSYHLKQRGIDHVVLERARVGDSWASRRRDSFTLVTPNWSVRLPGQAYNGGDPDGYMPRDEIVEYLRKYAETFGLPVRPGVEVTELRPLPSDKGWGLATNNGSLAADNVVVATGAFPEPLIMPSNRDVSPRVRQLHTSEYRNPALLPPGAVLVVGTGQSGIQIAEELLDAGREVYLCVGKCPRAPRRYRGKDLFWWLVESGFMDKTIADLPSPKARLACNPQVTGRDGGHDVDVWRLARRGAVLIGRWAGADGERVELADDLRQTLASAEEMSRKFLSDFDAYIAKSGVAAPPAESSPFDFSIPTQAPRAHLDLQASGVSTIVWATGFRPAYPWIRGCAFDGEGFPVTDRGVTAAPGLYFVGVHLLHTRKSGLLVGVGEDAAHVVEHLAARGDIE